MQLPPLDFADLSLLFATGAIILLVTTTILAAAHYDPIDFALDKRRLGYAAIVASILFLATVAIRIAGIILGT
jgi:hypothetical protein